MTARLRFRDAFAAYIPTWLADRGAGAPGPLNVGYRVLWSLAASLDVAAEVLVQGIVATWPGVGTPSALPAIGLARGVQRGLGDTDVAYGARLMTWLDQRRVKGSARELARQIQAYLPHRPTVRVIDRHNFWTTIDGAGNVTTTTATWDWDSVSNPERHTSAAPWWSELFVVIYSDPYAKQGALGAVPLGVNEGIGHKCPLSQRNALEALLGEWKSAHSKIRAVIWSPDPAYFVPGGPNVPNGQWGQWSIDVAGVRVASPRFADCRFWEP